jgi:hypothetical protein
MIDMNAAVTFVERHGTDLECARLRQVLYGTKPDPRVVRPFTQRQSEDGGFPFGMVAGNPSTVSHTLNGLHWLDELGMLASDPADRALRFLLARQKPDGGWDEDPAIAEFGPPPWAEPGVLRARLYLTALAAFWLGVMDDAPRLAFQRALDFLAAHQREDGKFTGFMHTTWIATSVFAMTGVHYQEVVDRGIAALSAEPLTAWVDSQICWALECFAKAGLPKAHPFVADCLTELADRQVPKGGWVSEDGAARSAAATIGVLKILKHYGLLTT